MKWRLPYFLFLVVALLTACSADEEVSANPLPVTAWLPLRLDNIPIQVQLALTPAEQRQGLMHRESLPEDGGMLFPYRREQQMSFWMANTPLPLDIAFFNTEGVLVEIRRMHPFDTTRIRSSSDHAQFALEMAAGWYKEAGILPGARLDMDLLASALRQRGENPALYGIGRN